MTNNEKKRLKQIEKLETLKRELELHQNQLKITELRAESIKELISETKQELANAESEMRLML
ncbi:MAG: hypothetical protein AB7V50_03120 [Vampirovibrionia bacterium]